MTNKKKKAIPKTEKLKDLEKLKSKLVAEQEADEFDFGGFPKDANLNKNIGCGG